MFCFSKELKIIKSLGVVPVLTTLIRKDIDVMMMMFILGNKASYVYGTKTEHSIPKT